MRVLFLTNIPSPYRIDFFNELGKLCDLTVLFERKSAADRDENWSGSPMTDFTPVFLKGRPVGNEAAFCLSVIKWLNKDKFDVFVIGGYSTPTGMLAIETLKLKGIKFLLSSDGGMIKVDGKVSYLVKKHFISSPAWWLSTGQETNNYLVHYGAKRANIYVYPFTTQFKKDILLDPTKTSEKNALRQELGLQGETVTLAVGQYIERKGFDVLLEAWRGMPASDHLVIIGSGPLKSLYEELIHKYQLTNVLLEDFQQKERLQQYYRASDLSILPTREDIWGLVINEAMGNGLPVISTEKCIAATELIENGVNGYVVPIDDPVALTLRAREILSSLELMEGMGRQSVARIKDFTIEQMAAAHLEIFNQILSSGRRSS